MTVQTTNEEPNVSGEEASKPTNVLTKPMSSLRSKVFDRVPSSSSKTYVPVYRNSSATTTPVRHQFDDYLMRKVTEAIDRLGRMSRLLVLGDAMFYKMSKTKERWNSWESSYAAINLGRTLSAHPICTPYPINTLHQPHYPCNPPYEHHPSLHTLVHTL